MALVTVQRSPSVSSSPSSDCGVAGCGVSPTDEEVAARNNGRSLSECYFAGKGAALVLPPHERQARTDRAGRCDIQQHLQSMFYLLRPEETLKMAVKLESAHAGRTRYLVVVSREGRAQHEESCLLGIDCGGTTAPAPAPASTVGLVLRVLADTAITLDGDGGFSVSVCGRQHIFKPVSVQAMWSALQTLHRASSKAREHNFFLGGLTHDWVEYYEHRIASDRSCLNEWHAMDSIESRRPPSPDSVRSKPREREETERVIRCTLKEIMMSVDLDEVTSKYIRSRLEDQLDMDLTEFKSFIDHEMLTILGQMDAATEIFDHVYLGSEWNASNLEELQKNGVQHIINVTKEIDNFFPGMFKYLNVRVYDDEKTDLLKHWDDTYKYIKQAREEGSKVLVHCKMGVSRSASVVIAYAMKAYGWDFKKALDFVRQKRSCIKPNTSFLSQLETYQGILDAMKNKEKLQRSKSETNLKSPGLVAKAEATSTTPARPLLRNVPGKPGSVGSTSPKVTPKPPRPTDPIDVPGSNEPSGKELASCGGRPKSWSPDNTLVSTLFSPVSPTGPTSVSLEHLNSEGNLVAVSEKDGGSCQSASGPGCPALPDASQSSSGALRITRNHNANVRMMPCGNGLMYSVSQNKVVHLPGSSPAPSVKRRVTQLESAARAGLVVNLNSQFEMDDLQHREPTPPSPPVLLPPLTSTTTTTTGCVETSVVEVEAVAGSPPSVATPTIVLPTALQVTTAAATTITATVPTTVIAAAITPVATAFPCPGGPTVPDPGGEQSPRTEEGSPQPRRPVDPFSNQLDRVFEREERRHQRVPATPERERECPSRQSSWSSCDSAVVLRDVPSRQSSWGSGDTRWGTLPSRNSSWGSFDLRQGGVDPPVPVEREDGSWQPPPATSLARRPRTGGQRIEEGKELSDSTASSIACLRLHAPRPYRKTRSRSPPDSKTHYASSPTLSSRGTSEDDVMGLLGSPPTDKIAVSQPNITLYHGSAAASTDTEVCLSVSAPAATTLYHVPELRTTLSSDESVASLSTELPGKVMNLKKEFEAKSGVVTGTKDNPALLSAGEARVRSVPSSPVSIHPERDQPPSSPPRSPASSSEDLSVRVLVGKYEVGKVNNVLAPANPVRTRIAAEVEAPLRKPSQPPIPPRKTSCEPQNNPPSMRHTFLYNNLRNGVSGGFRVSRASPSRSVVVASVVASANNKKQQQGKTHPLARLAINPVFNTL